MFYLVFLIHLNTYVIGLRPLEIFLISSAGIDFSRQCRRQILTTEVYPRTVRVNPLTAKLFDLNFHSLKVVSR